MLTNFVDKSINSIFTNGSGIDIFSGKSKSKDNGWIVFF